MPTESELLVHPPSKPPHSFWRQLWLACVTASLGILTFFVGLTAISSAIVTYQNFAWWQLLLTMALGVFTVALGVSCKRTNQKLANKPAKIQRVTPCCCERCHMPRALLNVHFHRHYGAIVMMIHREVSGFFCRDCIQKAFWSNTVPTLFLGWWGMLSVFITPVVLVSNLLEFWRQKRLIRQW